MGAEIKKVEVGKKVGKRISVDKKLRIYLDIAKEIGNVLDLYVKCRLRRIEGVRRSDGVRAVMERYYTHESWSYDYLEDVENVVREMEVKDFRRNKRNPYYKDFEFTCYGYSYHAEIRENFPLFGELGELTLRFTKLISAECLDRLKEGISSDYFIKVGNQYFFGRGAPKKQTKPTEKKTTEKLPSIWDIEIPKKEAEEEIPDVWKKR